MIHGGQSDPPEPVVPAGSFLARRVVLVVVSTILVACNPTQAPGPTSTQRAKLFSRGIVRFEHPGNWTFRITAEGAGVAKGCSAGFWGATAQISGGGVAGVSLCPSAFNWPPPGESVPDALQRELDRYGNEVGAVRLLTSDEMAGLPGIRAETRRDPTDTTSLESRGSQGVIYRAADLGSDPRKPDIFEVFCEASASQAAETLKSCELIAHTFQVGKTDSQSCSGADQLIADLLVENARGLKRLSSNTTPAGYREYIHLIKRLQTSIREADESDQYSLVSAGFSDLSNGYVRYVSTRSATDRRQAYRQVLRGQSQAADAARELQSRGCTLIDEK